MKRSMGWLLSSWMLPLWLSRARGRQKGPIVDDKPGCGWPLGTGPQIGLAPTWSCVTFARLWLKFMATPADPLIEKLHALYRETDALFAGWSCPESGDCCRFSVTGRQPLLWPIEWRQLGRALRANPPRKGSSPFDCPAFDPATRRCRAYAARPFGCRTHFCADASRAGRNPRDQIRQLARKLADLAAADQPSGCLRPLLSWQADPRR